MWGNLLDCHALAPLLVYAAGLLLSDAGACYLIYGIFRKFKWSRLACILLWVILTALSGIVVRKNSPPAIGDAFSVEITWMDTMGTTSDWCLADTGSVIPIRSGFLVNFTNLTGSPVMIDSYEIDEEIKPGIWKSASLPFGDSRFFIGPDRHDVTEVQYQTLDDSLANKNLAANETVRGWIFVAGTPWWPPPKYRFVANDTMGRSFTEPLLIKGTPRPIQPMMLSVKERHLNISTVPVADQR